MANKQFIDFDIDNNPSAPDVFLYQRDSDGVYKAITLSGLTAAVGGSAVTIAPVYSDKDNAASVTASDGDTSGVSITTTPVGFTSVFVNGILVNLGSGVKTKDCYFSSDGGTSAKTTNNIIAGDILYWNGSIAGYELAVTDRIDLLYNAAI